MSLIEPLASTSQDPEAPNLHTEQVSYTESPPMRRWLVLLFALLPGFLRHFCDFPYTKDVEAIIPDHCSYNLYRKPWVSGLGWFGVSTLSLGLRVKPLPPKPYEP